MGVHFMKISSLIIENFKSIHRLEMKEIDQALILVGKNNTGKTVVLDAILALEGTYKIKKEDYNVPYKPIKITGKITLESGDLELFHEKGMVSRYHKPKSWYEDFKRKLPSFEPFDEEEVEGEFLGGEVSFTYTVPYEGKEEFGDGFRKNNPNLRVIFPKIYFVDHIRNIASIQEDILEFQGNEELRDLRDEVCMFDKSKACNHCFACIGEMQNKLPEQLSIHETTRLLEYKLFQLNLNQFSDKLNANFQRNGGANQEIQYNIKLDVDELIKVETLVHHKERDVYGSIATLGAGLKSIYVLSLLKTYIEEKDYTVPCIIMMEDPEMFLHPQLQKTASEILYQLSKKNQVIFSTHSPNMIFNFAGKQIKQVMLDEHYETVVKEDTDVDEILNDLGYSANDLMNVNFVFIVEGKQDSSRLPMLLEKYYSEMYDEDGKLQRIAIVPVNSCTNIKTYANLKYINKLYLKDQFLMIRDSDGKDPNVLKRQLCHYYRERESQDQNNLPRVQPKNVLILKYYSFENYFLDPKTMVKIGLLKNEEEFYKILYTKYKDYLYRLGSTKRMIKATGIRINNRQDLKEHMEEIKIYVRGHNLFDIFYGRYKGGRKDDILRQYIDVAPREVFADILDAIDSFVYFENRKKGKEEE